MDEKQNQMLFNFNENPVENQIVDGGVLKSNAIPPFVENDESDNEGSSVPKPNTKMNLFNETQPCGSNGCSVAVKTMPPPPPKDFMTQGIPLNPTPAKQYLTSYFERTFNQESKKSSSLPNAVNKPTQRQAIVKKSIQQQAAQQQPAVNKKSMINATAPIINNQHQSAALPSKKIPPSPMFAKGKPVAPPKNSPPAQQQQQQAAPLPVVDQGIQQQQQNQANQLIRPTSRMSNKVIYPSLLWDGSITITNMKKATNVSNNKNYLQNNIAPTPYVQIYQMFPQFENVEFLRYLIGQEGIFLSYLLPRSSNARNQWKYNLTHDPEFFNKVFAYNEEQKKIMAEMNGITVEEVNNQINSILQTYLAINADKLNKKFSSGCKKQYNPYNNKVFFSNNNRSRVFNNSSFSLPNDVTFSKCNGSSCPTINGVELNNCLNKNPQADGFRRVVYSTNPCAVMYQKIENESDLQQCMIGSMSAIKRVASDEDCVVKYNMIKDFLDETGYHLVKNSKPKNKKKSRKN